MLCFVFIKSQSESLKAFQWVPRFVLRYASYKILIVSISIWFCYLKTVLIVLHLLSQKLPTPFDSFSHEEIYIGTLFRHVLLLRTRYPEFGKKFSFKMFVNNRSSQFLVHLKKQNKKTPR